MIIKILFIATILGFYIWSCFDTKADKSSFTNAMIWILSVYIILIKE